MRLARSGQQFAEKSVGGIGMSRHDQGVARPAHLDGGMEHQVVARMAKHGHRGAGDPRGRINRPHIGKHQSRATLRLVHRGCAKLPEFPD
jgi:hypothetical protein